MNDWNRLEKQAEIYKNAYPAGTRIMLLHMGADPRPISPNTRGTVKNVDSIGTIHCVFDNGRCLGLVPNEDMFRKLTEQELAEEAHSVDNLINEATQKSSTENSTTFKENDFMK